jgi:hypothetical protein
MESMVQLAMLASQDMTVSMSNTAFQERRVSQASQAPRDRSESRDFKEHKAHQAPRAVTDIMASQVSQVTAARLHRGIIIATTTTTMTTNMMVVTADSIGHCVNQVHRNIKWRHVLATEQAF